MTTNLAYVTESLTIILTDRRINYGEYEEISYSDDNIKLINLPEMGWASGTGLSIFLDTFKEKLSVTNINGTNEIIKMYDNTVYEVKREWPFLSELIDQSLVIASWYGFKVDHKDLLFRIGVLSNHHYGKGMLLIGNEKIFITYPNDYLENLEKIKKLEELHPLHVKFEGDLNEVLRRMFEIFKVISDDSVYVSSSCDLGLEVLTKEGIYKIKLSGEIDDLICELDKGSLENKFEIINVIT